VVRVELPGPNAQMRLSVWLALHFPEASIRCGVSPILRKAAAELGAYFTAGLRRFTLPLELVGTPFQRAVWQEVGAIGFGETRTYRDIASSVSRPRAVRAVGAAQGANPVPIVIPCHRVIGTNGDLTGYGGGLEIKRWLLEHEAGLAGRIDPDPRRHLPTRTPPGSALTLVPPSLPRNRPERRI